MIKWRALNAVPNEYLLLCALEDLMPRGFGGLLRVGAEIGVSSTSSETSLYPGLQALSGDNYAWKG